MNTFNVFSQFFEHNVCDKSDIPLDLKDKLHVRFPLITSQEVFRHYAQKVITISSHFQYSRKNIFKIKTVL